MTDIGARLERLEAKEAIIETLHRYAQSHAGPIETYLESFTDDAVLDHVGRDRTQGRAELRARFERTRHDAMGPDKLLLIEPVVVVEGDRATVRAEYVYLAVGQDGLIAHTFGRYEDELVRCPDRRWRIREKRIYNQVGRATSTGTGLDAGVD